MNYTASQIADITKGVLASGTDPELRVSYAFSDSREYEATPGLFIAIEGERVDGHIFVSSMTEMGHLALVQNEKYHTANTILVSDTLSALADLAEYYRLHELKDVKVVAVTGSVGKTGTKDMTSLAIGAERKVFKTPGNRNSNIGLPITLLSVPEDTEVAVMEAGISECGEMWQLSRMCHPDIAIVTNIGYSHILAFRTREGIRDEKLQILSHMREGGTVIFNGDEPLLNGITSKGGRSICCGIHNRGCCVRAEALDEKSTGISFTLCLGMRKYPVHLSVGGVHNAGNALYAVTAAYVLGVDVEKAIAALASYRPHGNRQNVYTYGEMTFIADYYNASPESMKAALMLLSKAEGRKIAVLADMLELGDYTEQLHALLGPECTKANVDILITVGTAAKIIAANCPEIKAFSFEEGDFDGVAEMLKSLILPGDTLLFKGSNRMNLGEIVKRIKGE